MNNIDLNKDRDNYYVQLNNELSPKIACQVTAMVQCLDIILNHDLRAINNLTNRYKQAEDCLRWYIQNNQRVQDYYKQSHGKTTIPAPEWGDVLVFAVNAIYRRDICKFQNVIDIDKINRELSEGKPLMVSMRYPGIDGHYVSITGYKDGIYIIDDPYKNTLLNRVDGYHCQYALSDLQLHLKGYGIIFNP
jgi:hypothetical protein